MMQEDQETRAAQPAAKTGMSRRGLLRGAGGIGVAGVTAGMLLGTTAAGASAAAISTPTDTHAPAAASEPLIAHVHDARTGEVDLYTGEQYVRVHNPALARALAHAATAAR